MKILITGAAGFIGSHLFEYLSKDGHEVVGLDRTGSQINTDLNLLDFSFLESLPGLTHVIHTAGVTSVDYCELHPDEAHFGNVRVVEEFLQNLPAGVRFIYLSSDYIYDGVLGNFSEASEPNPINVYGRLKLLAEQVVLKHSASHLVLRPTVVTGWDKGGKNFLTKLVYNLRGGIPTKVPYDQISNPTFMDELAPTVLQCLKMGVGGAFLATGLEPIGRYEFGLKIARTFALNEKLVEKVSTQDLAQPARRPLNNSTRSALLSKVTGIGFSPIEACLKRIKENEPVPF